MGNGKRETKRGKSKVGCFCYHEVNHAKSGKSKEEIKSGKLGMGGLREAVGAGLPTRNDQKALYVLAKRGEQGKRLYPAHQFLQGNTIHFVRNIHPICIA